MSKYREAYEFEHQNRARLRAAVAIPFGLLMVLGGVLIRMYQLEWFDSPQLWTFYFSVLLGASYYFCRASYLLIRSYHQHHVNLMPTAMEQKRYHEELVDWHLQFGGGHQGAQTDFDDWLDERYAQVAHDNYFENIAKSEYLFRATGATIFCAVLTVIAYVPYMWHDLNRVAEVQNMRLVNLGDYVSEI